MTYQEFKKQIPLMIQEQLGSSVHVCLQEVIKNNDTRLDGLTIFSEHLNISPTIYLNYYFGQYRAGGSLDDVCRDIIAAYRENLPAERIDISFFTDYEKVKNRIVFKLINYDRNQTLLTNIPHCRFLDLAVVFCCLLQSDRGEYATILIYNHHHDLWNITTDDLYSLSMKNTPALLSCDIKSMSDLLKELVPGAKDCGVNPDKGPYSPLYVLSNTGKLNGSGCILYQNLLQNFAEKMGSDLYVLPSSVHEVLLLPADGADSFRELSAIVEEINTSQLANEEILSDHAYYFSRDTGKLSMRL